jgi:uncharacterized membrane protein YdbT with pleckstrin-like domain
LADKVLYETYPSWIYYWKHLTWMISIPIFAILFVSIIGIYLPDIMSLTIAFFIILISLLISVGIFIHIWIERTSHKLKITENKVIYEQGFFSKKVKEIKKSDIRSVEIDQSFIDRLLNIGTLKIATPATSGYEIVFFGLKNPKGVKSKVEKLKKEGQKKVFKDRVLKKSVRFKKKTTENKGKKIEIKVIYADKTKEEKKKEEKK